MVSKPRPTGQVLKQARTAKKVSKHRHAIQRWRGKRSKQKEEISRVYSERRETKAISPMVAYKPYDTEQPISLESTAIYSMKYDPSTRLLWITFWKYNMKGPASTYLYYGVPGRLWTSLNEASSKGRFFYYMIRSRFKYSRVK